MEYNFLEMQVTPIIPKAVADEQVLVFVPVGQTSLAGILKPSSGDFTVGIDGLMTIFDGEIVENGKNFVRSGKIYTALSERDTKINKLQEDVQTLDSNKQDQAININGIGAKTVEGALAEIKGNAVKNAQDISGLNTTVENISNVQLPNMTESITAAKSAADAAQSTADTAVGNAATALSTAQAAASSADKANNDIAALQTTVNEHSDGIAVLMTKDVELEGKVNTNSDAIAVNTAGINKNTEDITKLEQAAYGGETPIGTYPSAATLPTDAQLTAFVQQEVSRAPKLGDVVLFTQIVTGGTDKSYKFMYTATGWSNYVIPTVESASNTDKGILQGTLNDTSGNIQVSIVAGKVADILVKDGSTFKSIKTLFDGLATSLATTNETVASNKASADQGIAEAKAAAAAVIKKLNDVTFTFVSDSDTTMSKFPCKYTANIEGVTVANVVDVYLSAAQIPLEIFSSYVQVEDGKVSIFATTKANYPTSLTVPTVRIS